MSRPPKLSKEDKKALNDSFAESKILRAMMAEMKRNKKDPLVKAQLEQIESHRATGNFIDLTAVRAIVGPAGRVINAAFVPASQMVSSTRAAPAPMQASVVQSVAGSSSDTSAQINTNMQIQTDEVYAQSLDAGIDPMDENFSYGLYDEMADFVPYQQPSAASYYHGPPDLSSPTITNYANGVAIATSAAAEADAITSGSPPMSPMIPMTPMGNYNMEVINAKTMEILKQREVERRHSELADKQQDTEDMMEMFASLDESQRRDVQTMIAFQTQVLNHKPSHSEIMQFLKIVQIPSRRAEMNDIIKGVTLDMLASNMVAPSEAQPDMPEAQPDIPEDMGGDPMDAAPRGLPFRDVLAEGVLQSWNRDHGFVNSAEYENASPIKTFSRTSGGRLKDLISTFVNGEPFELDAADYKKLRALGVFSMNVGKGVSAGGEYEPRLDPSLWLENANGSWSYAGEFYKAKDAEAWAQHDVRAARYAEFESQKQANNKRVKKMVPKEGQELFRAARAPAGSGEDMTTVSMGRYHKARKIIAVNPSGVSDGLGRISNKMDARPGGNFKHPSNYKDFSDRRAHPDNTDSGFQFAIPAPPSASASSGLYNPAATGFLSEQLSKNVRQKADDSILMSAADRAARANEIADLAKEAHFKTLGAEEWSRLRRDEEQNATEAQTRVGRDMMVPVLSAAAVRSEWDDLPDTSTANRYTNTFLRLQRQSENASLTSAEKAQNARDQDKYIKSLRRREVPERPEESWEQIEEMMARVRTAKNKVESDIAELLKKRKKKK